MRNRIALWPLTADRLPASLPALCRRHCRAMPGFAPCRASSPSGGYFTLHNDGKNAETLVGAASPACGMLMLHLSENKGGMSAMRRSDRGRCRRPARTLRFEPGSYHLMCMGATPAIQPGAERAGDAGHSKAAQKLTANFAVRDAAGK